MNSLSIRVLKHRQLAVLVAAALALVSVVVIRAQGAAHADTTTVTVKQLCSLYLSDGSLSAENQGLSLPLTTTDSPDPVASGDIITFRISSGVPKAALPVNVKSTTITTPIPAGLTAVGVPTYENPASGAIPNQTASASIDADGNLVVAFVEIPGNPQDTTGQGVPAAKVVVPDVIVQVRVDAAAGSTITWGAPTKLSSAVNLGGDITAECVLDPSGPVVLNTTAVIAGTTTTTATTTTVPPTTTTTTTRATTTTTAPTTTTTRATTTTTAPTTTTTRATTTTMATTTTTRATTTTTARPATTTTTRPPMTTTTRAPMTTTTAGTGSSTTLPGGGLSFFFRLIRLIICMLFHICS